MAKNKVAPDRPSKPQKNNFFVEPTKMLQKKRGKPSLEGCTTSGDSTTKKPFDKKAWRLKKYSRKYKVQQWEDKRKKAILRGYYRDVKDDESKMDVQKIYNDYDRHGNIKEENQNNLNKNVDKETKKFKPFQRAKAEFDRLNMEKQSKKDEAALKKQEVKEALSEYRKKKAEKYKKLSRKTKKGQPIMKDRMELLLEKIQKSIK